MTASFSCPSYTLGERLMQFLGIITLFAVVYLNLNYYHVPTNANHLRPVDIAVGRCLITALWGLPFMAFVMAAERAYTREENRMPGWVFTSMIITTLWTGGWLVAMWYVALR